VLAAGLACRDEDGGGHFLVRAALLCAGAIIAVGFVA